MSGEDWTHLKDTNPVAAKPHICYLCGEWIFLGERHVLRTGIMDGRFHHQRMHTECEDITRRTWDLSDWECNEPGSLPRPRKRDDV